MLTRRMRDLLVCIETHISETGNDRPTLTELGRQLGHGSKPRTYKLMCDLVTKGYIERIPKGKGRPCKIRVLKSSGQKGQLYLWADGKLIPSFAEKSFVVS